MFDQFFIIANQPMSFSFYFVTLIHTVVLSDGNMIYN